MFNNPEDREMAMRMEDSENFWRIPVGAVG